MTQAQTVSPQNAIAQNRKNVIMIVVVTAVVVLVAQYGIGFVMSLMQRSTSYSSYYGGYSNTGMAYDSVAMPTSSTKELSVTNSLTTNNQTRTITKNFISSHVKDSANFLSKLKASVAIFKGKIMDEYVSDSTDDSSSSGTLSVLIPNAVVESFIKAVNEQSIKIVSKQVTSYEISTQYSDLTRKLTQLEQTYSKLEMIYNKATSVEEILKVQTEMTNIQTQIDQVKGQKSYLEEFSENTQITIYFSTNELSLPYVPEGTFEFEKTFRLAVRNMIQTVDAIFKAGIYLIVFVPVLIVLGLVVLAVRFVYKRIKK